jgi:hypothetical protein
VTGKKWQLGVHQNMVREGGGLGINTRTHGQGNSDVDKLLGDVHWGLDVSLKHKGCQHQGLTPWGLREVIRPQGSLPLRRLQQ